MTGKLLTEVLDWTITWVPWTGLTLALAYLVMGVLAMGDGEGGVGRDFLLLSIAVSLITGLFVALVMVQ